jgi:hypothetical protein
MTDTAQLRVGGNAPRLLKEGETPPPAPSQLPPEELEAPTQYWTPDKAQHVVAQICRAGSKFYGPSVKAAEWELELIGDPAAAVLNDWLPLRVGASSDKTANLIALAAVIGILVLLRLPDILEVHGIIKPWKSPEEKAREKTTSPQAAPASQPAQPSNTVQPAFEPQLVGNGAPATGGEKLRDAVFGAHTVGGSGFVEERK